MRRPLLFMMAILMSMVLIFGCTNNAEGEPEQDTTLIVDEAKTITVGSDYEKIIVQAPGAVLEDGTVDEIIIEPSVGEGEVTLTNIQSNRLDVNSAESKVTIKGSAVTVDGSVKNIAIEGDGTELEVKGTVGVLVVTGKSNIAVTSKVNEAQFRDESQDSTISIEGEGVVKLIKTKANIVTKGKGQIEEVITSEKDNMSGEITPDKTTVQCNPFEKAPK